MRAIATTPSTAATDEADPGKEGLDGAAAARWTAACEGGAQARHSSVAWMTPRRSA